jgi:hypothetical protein
VAEPLVSPPPKSALDAHADQGLAHMRNVRELLAEAGPEGRLLLTLADGLAAPLREQFPGVPAGRVLMAAVQSLTAMKEEFADKGLDDADAVLSVAALAAEQLDREAGAS